MVAQIEDILQDSNSLDTTVTKHLTKMIEKGFEVTIQQELKDARQDLVTKSAAQAKVVEKISEATTAQNQIIESKRKLISQAKASAKSAYGNDGATLKLFRVGDDIPKSVKRLSTQCDYFSGLITERKNDFLKNSFTQVMLDSLTAGRTDIEAADTLQENLKKEQKSATMVRDAANKVLKDKIFRIRNFAKSCFADNPEILVEFEPIPKGRGGNGGTDTPPAPPTPPAQ